MILASKLLCMAPLAMGLESLQTHLSISSSTSTTIRPWPQLELGQFSASPQDPWSFLLHRKPTMGPSNTAGTSTTTTAPNPRSLNHQPDQMASENLISLTDIENPTTVYQRHELPNQVRRMSAVEGLPTTFTPQMYRAVPQKASKRPRSRKKQGGDTPEEVLVSIPKIFADMAFTGHFGKITIPRDKIRY